MHAHFSEVVDLLRTEAGICREMLEVMERERLAMLRSQLEPLKVAVVEKEALIQRLQAVERQREDRVVRLAQQLGCEAAELTLSRLTQAAPPVFEAALAECRIELGELVERLQTDNRRSAMWSSHGVELLQSFYKVIRGLAAKGAVYQPGGRMQAARLNGRLFSHEM